MDIAVGPVFEGKVLYEEFDECIYEMRISQQIGHHGAVLPSYPEDLQAVGTDRGTFWPPPSIPRQVKVYFANLEDYEATALKAFSENWNRFKPTYIFPPLVLMEMTPNRFYQCLGESRFTVICPRHGS